MAEGGCRSRVGEVVGRDVHGLHAGDGAVPGGGDALLHLAHFSGQSGLVAHGRRHSAQQGAHLASGLGETEDVVDEEEDVVGRLGIAAVAEALGQGEAAEGHAATGSGRFVHLTEDHGHLALRQGLAVHEAEVPTALGHCLVEGLSVFDNIGFNHLTHEVVTLTGTLSHACEHTESVMLFGDIVDEFLDEHRLSHTGATEQAYLAALQVGLQQVDDLDARVEHLLGGSEVFKLGRITVDGEFSLTAQGAQAVDGLAHDVHHAAANLRACRHVDGGAGAHGLHAAAQAVGGIHGNAAHGVFAYMLLHLCDKGATVWPFNLNGVVNRGEGCFLFFGKFEVNVHHRSDNLGNLSFCQAHFLESLCNPTNLQKRFRKTAPDYDI